MFAWTRRVRFEEVDAAQIVFFPRFFHWAHEAMEALFDGVEGGYPGVVLGRGVGFPAVGAEADYVAPARYGDTLDVEVRVAHLGRTSCRFEYRFARRADGQHVATVRHTCVCCDLGGGAPTKRPFPDDVRALLERHLVTPASTGPAT